MFGRGRTVEEARQDLLANRFTGTTCPVCLRRYQTRRRTITGAMAHALVRIAQRVPVGTPFHLPSLLEDVARDDPTWPSARQGGDAAKLYYWGLIERPHPQRKRRARSGTWLLTASGRSFAAGRHRVPRYAIIEARQLLALEGDLVAIEDLISMPFSLDETEIH